MTVHCSIDTRNCDWNKHQLANGDEVRFSGSALASRRLADDDLTGSQLSPGTPVSLHQDQVLINLLLIHSRFLALQTQHAANVYDKVII